MKRRVIYMNNTKILYEYLTKRKTFIVTNELLEYANSLVTNNDIVGNQNEIHYIKFNLSRLYQYLYPYLKDNCPYITTHSYILDKDIIAIDCIVFDTKIVLDRNIRNISMHRAYDNKPINIDTENNVCGSVTDEMIGFVNDVLFEKYWKNIVVGKEVYINNNKINLFDILSQFFSSIDIIRRDYNHNKDLIYKTKDYILLDNKVIYDNKILPWKNLNIL